MGKCNIEGYRDLTAYHGIINADKEVKPKIPAQNNSNYKPLVYICCPFKDDPENNIVKAKKYCKFAVANNAIPLAVTLHYPQFLDDSDPKQRELALFFGLVLLGKCDELWCFGDNITSGMEAELHKAHKRNMMIRYFDDNMNEYATVAPADWDR